MSKDKKGRYFEDSTFEMLKEFNPDAKVYENVRLSGKLSKTKRQIDVLVEPKMYDYLVFECKDHKRPIGVTLIESFRTKLEDVGAKKGAVVSNSPYSRPAQSMASELKIDLLSLVDTSDERIRTKLYASTLLSDVLVKRFSVKFACSHGLKGGVPLDVTELTFVDGERKATAYEVFVYLWNNSGSLSEVPGTYEYRLPKGNGKRILGLNGEKIDLDSLTFIYEIVEKHFLGEVEIIKARGVYNVAEGSFRTKSITTEFITPHEVEKIWKEVSPAEVEEAKKGVTLGLSVRSILSEKQKTELA